MKLYKLTTSTARTGGTLREMRWGEGVTHRVARRRLKPRPCTADVIHAYAGPELALLMNHAHAAFSAPRLWEAEGEPCVVRPDKVGCYELTTVREMETPAWFQRAGSSRESRIALRFAVTAAEAVLPILERRDDSGGVYVASAKRALDNAMRPDFDFSCHALEKAVPMAVSMQVMGDGWAAYRAAMGAQLAGASRWSSRSFAAAEAAYWAGEADPTLDLADLARQAVAMEVQS